MFSVFCAQRAIDGSLCGQYQSHYCGGDSAATVHHGKQLLLPAASRSDIVSITCYILTLTRNSSNRTALQTPMVCVLRNVVVSPLLFFFVTVLCADRVGQMTKTYNDIDAVTRLLEEVTLLIFQWANCSETGTFTYLILSRNYTRYILSVRPLDLCLSYLCAWCLLPGFNGTLMIKVISRVKIALVPFPS